jgi:AraC-like DNA-binding protein
MVHQAEQHKVRVPGIEAVTLVSNQHFPRHTHDQFGFGVIDSGGHRSWSAIGTVTASVGDMIMVNPGEMHDGAPLSEGARRWRMIYVDPKLMVHEVEEEIAGRIEIVRPVARDSKLARRFNRLFRRLTCYCSDRLATEESLLSAFTRLLAHHSTARPAPDGPSPIINKAVTRLNAAVDEPVSLAELAALAGVSRFKLLRSFAREVGITPHAYLIQRRLLMARKLLAAGCTPVQAAMDTGFADQSHLTRAFVRQFAVTPGRYRAASA